MSADDNNNLRPDIDFDTIFHSKLVQSIREATANIEKISCYEWEDMLNQHFEEYSI